MSWNNIEELSNGVRFALQINFRPKTHLKYAYPGGSLKACWWFCSYSVISALRHDYFFILFYMILENSLDYFIHWFSSTKKGVNFLTYLRNTTFWLSFVKWFRSKLFESNNVCQLPATRAKVYRFSFFLLVTPHGSALQYNMLLVSNLKSMIELGGNQNIQDDTMKTWLVKKTLWNKR